MIAENIKIDARAIWKILVDKKSILVSEIKQITNSSETYIFLALGWLLKEKKVHFHTDNNGALRVLINDPSLDATSANKPYTDIFY